MSTTKTVTPFSRMLRPNPTAGEKRVFTGVVAHCQLMLESTGAVLDVVLPPDTSPLMVGRATSNMEQKIHVNLAPFNGTDLGVSRSHAHIERSGSRVFLRDLGSTNGTFINGDRLKPMHVYEIRHGDELQFGRLGAKMYVKSQP